MNQKNQLDILKSLTGLDFKFIPADKNKYGVKAYSCETSSEKESDRVAVKFNEENILYKIDPQSNGKENLIVLEKESDWNRALAIENLTNDRDEKALKDFEQIGQINGNPVFLEILKDKDNNNNPVVEWHQRAVAVVNINGKSLPFYVSSGLSGKEQEYGIASGKWYPLQGISDNWLNKMPDMEHNPYPELDEVVELLEARFPAGRMKQFAMEGRIPRADRDFLLKTANRDFPEGVSDTENANFTYFKNNEVYLKKIINTWRNKPADYFENAHGNKLEDKDLALINQLQEEIDSNIIIDGDYVFFEPTRFSENKKAIKNSLINAGVEIYQEVESEKHPNLYGMLKRDLVYAIQERNQKRLLENQNKKAAFEKANANIKKSEKSSFNMFLKRMKDYFNE